MTTSLPDPNFPSGQNLPPPLDSSLPPVEDQPLIVNNHNHSSPGVPINNFVQTPPVSETNFKEPPTATLSQPPKEKPKLSNGDLDFFSTLMLAIGPLFMIGALVYSFSILPKTNLDTQDQSKKADIMTIEKVTNKQNQESMRQTLDNVPLNPTQVSCLCQTTNQELKSGLTDCPNPVFTWTGDQTQELNTKIVGYYVYFGPNGNDQPISPTSPVDLFQQVIRPIHNGVFQNQNIFAPQNLVKGQKYYLAVSAVSDSQNPLWKYGLDIVDKESLTARSAKILFVYDYQ